MFNPFMKFESRFVPQFRKLAFRYLVSQTFSRDNDLLKAPETISLMLSNYKDKAMAQMHLSALKGDKYAAIIDLENDKHRNRVEELLTDEKYNIYSNIVQDTKTIKNALDKIFGDKIKNYIRQRTRWRIGSDKTIVPVMEITFGELFVILKYNNETIRVNLQEIEGY